MSSTTATLYSLVYRGNAIDGWIAAFLAHTALKGQGHETRLYSIGAAKPVTDHQVRSWKGTDVILLDLSMDKASQQKMIDGGVLSITCLDHHEASVADWPEGMVDPTVCTALQAWRRFYGEQVTPFWLDAVNRISLWQQPLWEDRCLREVLMPLAHMPPPSALRATEALMTWMTAPSCAEFQGLMAQGQQRLMMKDQELMVYLMEQGRTHLIQEADAKAWGLTPEWVGLPVFLLDNSEKVIDTNEAAHLVFAHAGVGVFINYRKKMVQGQGQEKAHLIYRYSARSVAFDLRTGGFFQGQAHSAGAQAQCGAEAPFVTPAM